MAKGDFIHVKHTVGTDVILDVVVADKAGRQVDSSFVTEGKVNWLKLELQSRSGKVIESVLVPTEQILAITIHKKDE